MEDVYSMRDVSGRIVRAVKSVKHLRRNATRYSERPQGVITDLYNGLRTEIARILVEIDKLAQADPDDRSSLWLEQERIQVERDAQETNSSIDGLIRARQIDAKMATSFLNDSNYAYSAMRDLLAAAWAYYIEPEQAMAEVERILTLDDEEVKELADTPPGARDTNPPLTSPRSVTQLFQIGAIQGLNAGQTAGEQHGT